MDRSSPARAIASSTIAWRAFSGSSAQGASVELTINSKLQDIAYNALQAAGVAVALNLKEPARFWRWPHPPTIRTCCPPTGLP